jgi:ClpP class serine protease
MMRLDWNWLFLILLFYSLLPVMRQWKIKNDRFRTIHKLESKRGSRVITLIHRQESFSFLGIPFRNFITIEDSEQILRAIRLTPDNMPIDLILHTPGGLVLASEQIAEALKKHPSKVTVFVPHYAMSGGTMISLAADEIVLDENAVLGPIDPQIGQYPADSILEVTKVKKMDQIKDETLIMSDMARKAIQQVKAFAEQLLSTKMSEEKAEYLAQILTEGRWTHDYPITGEQLKKWVCRFVLDFPRKFTF